MGQQTRIAALDGWRGIAILFVLADHYELALVGDSHSFLWGLGQHGVTIFFVLSGYLITGNLLKPGADLRSFYARRFLRLMPVAWAYLLLLWAIGPIFHARLLTFAAPSLLFYRNFIPELGWTAHFWSLSIEEQFYFVWPAVLLLSGRNRAFWIAVLGSLSCASFRFTHWNSYYANGLNWGTQVRADAILVGCVFAIAMSYDRCRDTITKTVPYLALPALAVLFYCVAHFRWLPPLTECVAIAVLLVATLESPLLGFGPLAYLGRISYSVYVWQELFVNLPNAVVSLILVAAFSLMSYYLIERPMTRMGRRLAGLRFMDMVTAGKLLTRM